MQDALSIWIDIKERFDRINGTKICYLHNDLYSLQQGASTVAEYYTKLHNIWEQLTIMAPNILVMEEFKEYAEYLQQQKLYKFLLALNDSFNSAHSHILLMCPLPFISQAYAMIVEEEQWHGNNSIPQTPALSANTANSIEQATFLSNKNNNNTFKSRRDNNIACDYCHKQGHKKA